MMEVALDLDALTNSTSVAMAKESLPRHRWYSVKESFSAGLVRLAVQHEECEENDLIFDPFCGGGTTPVAVAAEGFPAVGVEVNPFLAFVAKAKLSRVRGRTFAKYSGQVEAGIERGHASPFDGYSTFTRSDRGGRGLFNREVLRAFEGGWLACSSIGPNDVSRPMKLALIAAAMDVCNAVRDGKALRYRQNLLDENFDGTDFAERFSIRVQQIGEDLEASIVTGEASIWNGDCRRRISRLAEREFRLCVTSPPYLNSFDYSDVYRPELFLGGFVESTAELHAIRIRTVRSHVQANWPRPKSADFGQRFETSFRDISERVDTLWDKRIPLMIQAYFQDMNLVLGKLRKAARRHASVWLVVSTSAYGGIEIPVDLIIADIGCQVGWHLRDVHVVRHLRSSGQHWNVHKTGHAAEAMRPPLRESLIILDATTRRPARSASRAHRG